MLGLGSNISKTGKLGVHDLGIVTSNLVLKHNYDLSSVQPLSDGAAFFDGSDDIVDLGDKNGLGSSTTITAWVWAKDVTSNGAIITFGDTMVRFDSSTSLKVFPDVSGGASTSTFNDIIGRWVHVGVTITIDGSDSDVLIYEDGVLIDTETKTWVPSTDSRASSIGSYVGGSLWSGYMCNVGLWNATLSQAQIKSIMNKNYAGLSDSEKEDLVSWWNLDSVITDTTSIYDNHYGGGEVLGTEKTLNGTFINGLDSWSNSGVTESGGVVTFDADAATDYIFQNISYTDDKVYAITLEGTGNAKIRVGYSGIAATQTVVGVLPVTLNLFVDSTANRIQIYKNSGDELLLTSVSIKEINGNTGTLS